jgi:hypothetical protein
MTNRHIEFSNDNKVVLSFNIDTNTARTFTKFCSDKGINRSFLLRRILKDFCRDADTNYKSIIEQV